MNSSKYKILNAALKVTFPVFLGYIAIGIAFGLLLTKAGYSWALAPLMSLMVYAGSGQMILVGFFASNAGFFEIALAITLIHLRHCFYGISFLKEFKSFSKLKYYMIFALTDETYALLTGAAVPDDIDREKFFFLISMLDQSYWVIGSIIGALMGTMIPFDMKGLDFALTSLFIVLALEQMLKVKKALPFITATLASVFSIFVIGRDNMLLVSIIISIAVLMVADRMVQNDAS